MGPYALTYIAFGAGDDSTVLYHLSEAGLLSDAERAQQKRERPADHERACQADEALRRFPRMRSDLFVHRSRKPLREVVFKDAPDGWKNDCSGRCSS